MEVAKRRPVKAVIHLGRLDENIRTIKKHVVGKKSFFAVVKADAYGHGAVEIAKRAEQNGVDGFCVALLDEAITLRQAGITLPILVLGLTQVEWVQDSIDYNISLTVTSLDFLQQAQHWIKQGTLSVHVAVDTGMNRIGVKHEQAMMAIENFMADSDKFHFEGVFTHFATADGEDDNRVHKQYERFEQLVNVLQKRPQFVHLANSAMTIWRQQYPSDIARIGIAMYGLNPSDFVLPLPYELKPVLTLETEISHVHLLKQGEAVSYGAKYIAKKDEWIATLPLGYADGWRRDLAKQGVYVNGEKCDIVGVICMDQMMIRLSQPLPIGTKVELIGEHQSASDLAVSVGTIGYEILCGLTDRIERVYQ